MPSNASVQLHAIAAALKARGERGMKRELTAGLRAGAAPLVSAVRDEAARRLPHEGGLAERVSGERVTVSVRVASPRTAGVRLLTRTHDTRATNAGYVRHPVYGRPNSWVRQEIPQAQGWWTHTLATKSHEVTPKLLAVMKKIAAEIQAAGRI